MSDHTTPEADNYLVNYNRLRDTVGQIRNMSEPDVDALVPLVEGGTRAIAKCMDRIEKVEQMLGLEPINDNPGE